MCVTIDAGVRVVGSGMGTARTARTHSSAPACDSHQLGVNVTVNDLTAATLLLHHGLHIGDHFNVTGQKHGYSFFLYWAGFGVWFEPEL